MTILPKFNKDGTPGHKNGGKHIAAKGSNKGLIGLYGKGKQTGAMAGSISVMDVGMGKPITSGRSKTGFNEHNHGKVGGRPVIAIMP